MPSIVLLPGMDGTGALFAPLVAALGRERDVIIVRYPANEALGYAGLEAIVRAALPVTGEYILLGESFSGPLVITIAASRPPGLVGMVLSCSFARNPRPWLAPLLPLTSMLAPRLAPDMLLRHLLMGKYGTPALMAQLTAALREVTTTVFQTRLRAVMAADVSRHVPTIAVPLLYLRARADRLVPPSAAAHVAALARDIDIVEIDGPHLLLQARPGQAATAIERFLRRCSSSASQPVI